MEKKIIALVVAAIAAYLIAEEVGGSGEGETVPDMGVGDNQDIKIASFDPLDLPVVESVDYGDIQQFVESILSMYPGHDIRIIP